MIEESPPQDGKRILKIGGCGKFCPSIPTFSVRHCKNHAISVHFDMTSSCLTKGKPIRPPLETTKRTVFSKEEKEMRKLSRTRRKELVRVLRISPRVGKQLESQGEAFIIRCTPLASLNVVAVALCQAKRTIGKVALNCVKKGSYDMLKDDLAYDYGIDYEEICKFSVHNTSVCIIHLSKFEAQNIALPSSLKFSGPISILSGLER